MLSDAFFKWWFEPWTYARESSAHLPMAGDELARRDGYRLWCKEANVQPDFPPQFDPAWSAVATMDSEELTGAARLFAGLIAVRAFDQAVLHALSMDDRRWCASIAATQPLSGVRAVCGAATDAVEIRGLAELAARLEREFPGMWSRLRLLLPDASGKRVDELLANHRHLGEVTASAMARALRCWRFCCTRATSIESDDDTPASRFPEAVGH